MGVKYRADKENIIIHYETCIKHNECAPSTIFSHFEWSTVYRDVNMELTPDKCLNYYYYHNNLKSSNNLQATRALEKAQIWKLEKFVFVAVPGGGTVAKPVKLSVMLYDGNDDPWAGSDMNTDVIEEFV